MKRHKQGKNIKKKNKQKKGGEKQKQRGRDICKKKKNVHVGSGENVLQRQNNVTNL